MACARTVAVVVPSPATSDVLLATSLTIWAPMFSSASFKSISFATVTPSLVIVGDPNVLPRMTLRPFGPSVTLTASARLLIPRNIARRDASPYVIWLAISGGFLRGDRPAAQTSSRAQVERLPCCGDALGKPRLIIGDGRQARGVPPLAAAAATPVSARCQCPDGHHRVCRVTQRANHRTSELGGNSGRGVHRLTRRNSWGHGRPPVDRRGLDAGRETRGAPDSEKWCTSNVRLAAKRRCSLVNNAVLFGTARPITCRYARFMTTCTMRRVQRRSARAHRVAARTAEGAVSTFRA